MRRFFIVLFGASIMALAIFEYWPPQTYAAGLGATGAFEVVPVAGAWYRLTAVQHGTSLQKGDLIALGRLSRLQLLRLSSAPSGYRVPVQVRRNGREFTVGLVALFARKLPVDWGFLLTVFLWTGLATLVAARKPSAMTVSFLAFTAFLLPTGQIVPAFGFLSDRALAVVIFLQPLIMTFPNIFLAAFAVRFPSGLNKPWRRHASVAIYVALVAALGFDLIRMPLRVFSLYSDPIAVFETWLTALAVFAIAVTSYVQASASERPRIGIVLAGLLVALVASGLIETLQITPNSLPAEFVNAMWLALPIAVAYAVLRYRVIDLGFALNRTATYGITSLVLIGLFAALEWAAARLIASANHVESSLIDLAITVIVFFSFRLVHVRVDRAVDNVLFRKRHEDEAALQRFEHNAHFYTNRSALLRDALDEVQQHCELREAGIYLRLSGDFSAIASSFQERSPIDANDRALVDARANRAVLDLLPLHTAVPGVRLYPMLVATELIGFLTVGEREGFEEMPADIERSLIALVVSLGHSIHALRQMEKDAEIERLRDQIAMLSLKGTGAQAG